MHPPRRPRLEFVGNAAAGSIERARAFMAAFSGGAR
jgi:hypothetical protein